MTREEFRALSPEAAAGTVWTLLERHDELHSIMRHVESGRAGQQVMLDRELVQVEKQHPRSSWLERFGFLDPEAAADLIAALVQVHPQADTVIGKLQARDETERIILIDRLIAEIEKLPLPAAADESVAAPAPAQEAPSTAPAPAFRRILHALARRPL